MKEKNMEEGTQTFGNGSSEIENASGLQDLERDVRATVKSCIDAFQSEGNLCFPADYDVDKALTAAFVFLSYLKDPSGRSALEFGSADNIAAVLLDMVIQGLSVNKRQCRFMAFGGEIKLIRTYFGTIAMARKACGIIAEPIACIIGRGDDFEFETDPASGKKRLVRHRPALDSMGGEIVGAYCILHLSGGVQYLEVLGPLQISALLGIRQEDMSRAGEKTILRAVINRACRNLIDTSPDAYMYEGMYDESDLLSMGTVPAVAEAANAGNISDNAVADIKTDPVEQVRTEERPAW